METTVYWFSGTGNSLHVARAIADGLGDTRLVHAARALESGPVLSGRTGLVFPVYSWGPPVMMAELVKRLTGDPAGYVFAVATYGGAPGSTISITRRMLAERGIPLDASWTVRMVENYPPFGGAPPEEKQAARIEAAEREMPEVVRGIRDGVTGDHGNRSFLFSAIGRIAYPMFRKYVHRSAGRFRADDRCTSCGICARVCPSANISVPPGGKPVWSDRCEQCYACFHWCPEKAVQYGRKTAGQPRYHHPGVTLRDMIVQGQGEVEED
jgi:ferredoxin